MPKRLTKEEFISKSKKVHGDLYDYKLINYVNASTKVDIICNIHGIFRQNLSTHISQKSGCSKCHYSTDRYQIKFIESSKLIHNNIYDYSLVDYKNNKTKVIIICNNHGRFEQNPEAHLSGKGCKKCYLDSKTYTIKQFIKKANKIHNNVYDYSLVDYKNSKTNVKIICMTHGIFTQIPNNHTSQKNGCPTCNNSKSEVIIENILIHENIKYIREYSFDECKNILKLPFDFYLPECNIIIEYDGKHHYEIIEHWGGKQRLLETIYNDNIKNNFCHNKNITLFRITYKDDIHKEIHKIINTFI